MMNEGLIGWRGMVGTVLLQRMREEEDFKHLNAHKTHSMSGEKSPEIAFGLKLGTSAP